MISGRQSLLDLVELARVLTGKTPNMVLIQVLILQIEVTVI